jgi:hypothetical protein
MRIQQAIAAERKSPACEDLWGEGQGVGDPGQSAQKQGWQKNKAVSAV